MFDALDKNRKLAYYFYRCFQSLPRKKVLGLKKQPNINLQAALAGDHREAARIISLIENDPAAAQLLFNGLESESDTHVIGFTGPPGVGKSTLIAAIADKYTGAGKSLAVLAIDPSSPRTGGAILGDRVRMQRLAEAPNLFVRSMSARGSLGGLSPGTQLAVTLLRAMPFDLIFVETVGAGQSDVEISKLADHCVVLVSPDYGDSLQIAKSGLLEIADTYVVSKSARSAGNNKAAELREIAKLTAVIGEKVPEVVCTDAPTGLGIDALIEVIVPN